MDFRSVLLVGVVVGAGAVASSTACSGPDPGSITFSERSGSGTEQSSGSSGGSGSSGNAGSSGATGDGGTAVDDPIFGTSTFAYEDPGVVANEAAPDHNGTVEGKDCVTGGCHLDNDKRWAFAGTVYTDTKGITTVPKAEVRVVNPDGTEYGHAYTDKNGNFWLENATPFPEGSKVGVRKEGGKATQMVAVLKATEKGCNAVGTCHGGSQGTVYAP